MPAKRIINFAAGPAKVPEEVLVQAQKELIHYKDSGISVMELSHRSKTFEKIIQDAEDNLRNIMKIPEDYAVLFLGGGGTGQFSSIPLNLCPELGKQKVDYILTGSWSEKGAEEAKKYCQVNLVTEKQKMYTSVPDVSSWKTSTDASYLYYCDNETIHGVEFPKIPGNPQNVPLICDMTSSFLTKPVDVTKYGAIIAGTQKNVGIAGLAIVIVKRSLINPMSICPTVLNYKIMDKNKSLYNTPPCYPIYITGLCLEWIKKKGGLEGMSKLADERSSILYSVIDGSNGFYSSPVGMNFRSRLTIPFRVGGSTGNEELEKKFLDEALGEGMIQLKGHRSVGGIRASLYNAMTVEEVQMLVSFMKRFQQKYNSALA